MLMGWTVILFILLLALAAYTVAGYPLLVWWLSRRPRPTRRREDYLPFVSLLVPVFNEERVLREKLANSLALNYPPDRLEIVFVSDGSTDGSVAILRESRDPRVRLLDFPVNRGKALAMNETLGQLRGELVALSDASGMLAPGALRAAVPHLADPEVGAVCGYYHIFKEDRTSADAAESSYHGFEIRLRWWEGLRRTALSGTGSFCVFRRDQYQPLPAGVINDDFILPARLAARGLRVIYEPAAKLYDRLATRPGDAFRRRVRIAYGNWEQLWVLRELLDLRRGWPSWVFWSHKVLRMSLPFLLVLLGLLALSFGPVFLSLALLGAVALLVLGLLGLALDRFFPGHNPLAFVPLFFLNCAAVAVGTWRFWTRRGVRW